MLLAGVAGSLHVSALMHAIEQLVNVDRGVVSVRATWHRAPCLERHHQEGPAVMWSKPAYVELRFGFEVTMYSEYR